MIHDFLNNLPNLPLAIGIMLLAAIVGVLSVRLARWFLDVQMLKEHNDLIGFIYQMMGVLYAVMLAFAIFIVWEQFDSTNTAVEREANSLVSLYEIGRALPQPAGMQLKRDVVNYAHVVADDEWNRMALGRSSDASRQALLQLATFERAFTPTNEREVALYEHAVQQIQDLNSYRRLRLLASRGQIPRPMWVLLLGGGLFMIAFTAIFGADNARLHSILTAILAAGLGFTLFMILALDTPYTGSFAVTQEPFNDARALFEANP